MATYFVNSSTVGVDLNNTNSTAQFALGTKVLASNNSEWVYVYATGALSTGFVVGIQTAFTALPVSTNITTVAQMLGVANGAFAAGDYGWVCIRGDGVTVAISGSGTLSTQLYVANTSGYIATTAGSATLAGIQLNAVSTTATLTTTTAILTYPRGVSPGM